MRLELFRGGTFSNRGLERTIPSAAPIPPTESDRCWPGYTVPTAGPVALQEVCDFIEDIRMNVVFIDLLDHATQGLARLTVRAQLLGASGVQDATMSGTLECGRASFMLPLTTYLIQRVVGYQVSSVRTDGTTAEGTWLNWDVATAGCLKSLTWAGLSFPDTA
jgi:hypothetical protein